MITYEDFKKIELKVAKIILAEKVEGSEKLIKLEVDLGLEKRQIIAGIGKAYTPEQLIGMEVVIVANLEPRKLMGLESNGMLLAASPIRDASSQKSSLDTTEVTSSGASNESGPVLLIPQKEIQAGSEIK